MNNEFLAVKSRLATSDSRLAANKEGTGICRCWPQSNKRVSFTGGKESIGDHSIRSWKRRNKEVGTYVYYGHFLASTGGTVPVMVFFSLQVVIFKLATRVSRSPPLR